MGRTLPWKRGGDNGGDASVAEAASSSSRVATPTRPAPPARAGLSTPASPSLTMGSASRPNASTTSANRAISESTASQRYGAKRTHRSSSPESPKPVPEPPSQRLMVPGLQNDDQWRMVEDEFVAVAHRFTAHLHAAEYQRLKDLAQKENANTINSMSRPVTGPTTGDVKRRQATLALATSQRQGLKRALSRVKADNQEDDIDELPWAGTHLQDLMESPRKKPPPLTRMVSTVSGTRAAALNLQDNTLKHMSPVAKNSKNADIHDPKVTAPLTTSRMVAGHSRKQPSKDDGGSNGLGLNSPNHDQAHPKLASQAARSTPLVHAEAKPTAKALLVNESDDSDSPVEDHFALYLKSRRAKRQSSRYNSSTPDEMKKESQPSQKTNKRDRPSALSIPSV